MIPVRQITVIAAMLVAVLRNSFKPGNHLSTTVQCDVCHTTNRWAPTDFTHSAQGNYPGDHRRDPGCQGCHGNSVDLPFNYPFNQYAPDCAACHANDFDRKGRSHWW